MSIAMSLLAILEEAPTYGLRLKNEFESRTGAMWPLNVGQVYGTLGRFERDGLVEVVEERPDGQRLYEVTEAGLERLRSWFDTPTRAFPPARDELALKLIMAVGHGGVSTRDVIQAERRSAVQLLQELTLLKRKDVAEPDLGWAFLLDSLIFQTEARVRWLDDCETRIRDRELSPDSTEPSPHAVGVRRGSEVLR